MMFLFLQVLVSCVVGVTLYATPDGVSSSSNNCQTLANPCSLKRAFESAQPFDTIRASAGLFLLQSAEVRQLNLNLVGEGIGVTIFSGNANSAAVLLVFGNSSLTASDVSFSKQTSDQGAVFVQNGGGFSCTRCEFSFSIRTSVVVQDGVLSSNVAIANSVFRDGNLTFPDNSQFRGGLGIKFDGAGTLRVHQTSFLRNRCFLVNPNAAFHKGCAVDIRSSFPTVGNPSITLSASVFEENDASYSGVNSNPIGAALYMNTLNGVLNISKCKFLRNRAFFAGGAVFLANPNSVIEDTLFQENSILGSNGASGAGGALFVDSGIANVNRCTFRKNAILFVNASVGSAVAVGLQSQTITYLLMQDVAFLNNTGLQYAHGAIGVSFNSNQSVVKVERPYFCGNVAGPLLADYGCAGGGQLATTNFSAVQSPAFLCQGNSPCQLFVNDSVALNSCSGGFSSGDVFKPCDIVTRADSIFAGQIIIIPSDSSLNVSSSGPTVIDGNLQLSPNSTINVQAGGLLVVSGQVNLANASLSLQGQNSNGTVPVIQAGQGVVGQFTSVVASSSDPCLSASATPLYGASTVSALVTVTPNGNANCPSGQSGGLSTGAIVGIAIGATVGGILLAILVYFLTRNLLRARQKRMIAKMRESEIQTIQSDLDKVKSKHAESDAKLQDLDGEVKTLSTNHMHQMIEEKKLAQSLKKM